MREGGKCAARHTGFSQCILWVNEYQAKRGDTRDQIPLLCTVGDCTSFIDFFRNPRLNFLVFFRGAWLRMAQHEISPSYPTLTSSIPPTANHSGTVDNPGSSHGTLFIVV